MESTLISRESLINRYVQLLTTTNSRYLSSLFWVDLLPTRRYDSISTCGYLCIVLRKKADKESKFLAASIGLDPTN